jgi:hypothetical protein
MEAASSNCVIENQFKLIAELSESVKRWAEAGRRYQNGTDKGIGVENPMPCSGLRLRKEIDRLGKMSAFVFSSGSIPPRPPGNQPRLISKKLRIDFTILGK